jgi:Transglycosylase SLT domain
MLELRSIPNSPVESRVRKHGSAAVRPRNFHIQFLSGHQISHNGWNLMRYLFAALTAAFVVTADFESSHKQSLWLEPTFVVAMAQTEATAVNPDSQNANVNVSVEPSGSGTSNVEPARGARPNEAEIAAKPNGSMEDDVLPDPICEAIRDAAAEHDIPIGFLARLLWQESRFRAEEVSNAGARGIAQFMPQTAIEVGLKDPFDPLQAIPASARFLRKLYDQFGNLGLAAAAYNAGGGRIEKWLSRRASLPKETRDYVKIITGNKAEDWTDAENTVFMPTVLPEKAPCEGVGGLSKKDQVAEVPVDLAPSVDAMLRKAEADDADDKQNAALKKLRLVAGKARAAMRTAEFRKTRVRLVLHVGRAHARKSGKQSAVRLASAGGTVGRTKSSRAAGEL